MGAYTKKPKGCSAPCLQSCISFHTMMGNWRLWPRLKPQYLRRKLSQCLSRIKFIEDVWNWKWVEIIIMEFWDFISECCFLEVLGTQIFMIKNFLNVKDQVKLTYMKKLLIKISQHALFVFCCLHNYLIFLVGGGGG